MSDQPKYHPIESNWLDFELPPDHPREVPAAEAIREIPMESSAKYGSLEEVHDADADEIVSAAATEGAKLVHNSPRRKIFQEDGDESVGVNFLRESADKYGR